MDYLLICVFVPLNKDKASVFMSKFSIMEERDKTSGTQTTIMTKQYENTNHSKQTGVPFLTSTVIK